MTCGRSSASIAASERLDSSSSSSSSSGRHAFAADIGDVVVAGARAAGLFLLLGGLAVGLDLLRALELRRSLGFRTGIGRFEIDDLAQQRRAFVQFVAPDDERLEGQRALAETCDHRFAAGLDALGDGDFAFARQKLDRTHFAQIHAHRIVGTVGRLLLLGGRKRGAAGRRQFAAFALLVDRRRRRRRRRPGPPLRLPRPRRR